MRVLNVGGGPSRKLPHHFKGWDQDLLDIDSSVSPDVCCDAKDMGRLKSESYDAVFCSHNLEHFYRHEVPQVLAGFMHVLKPHGFAQIAVPDLNALFRDVAGRDIDDVWYRTAAGVAITFHDVLYGWDVQMKQGNLYYAHKRGFTEKSLAGDLRRSGFKDVYTAGDGFNIHAYGFKTKATPKQRRELGL